MIIRRYESKYTALWDEFLDEIGAPSFIFQRAFMAYHHPCFTDHSVLVFDTKNQLCALFPANQNGMQIRSHQGLSYGGIILKKHLRFTQVQAIFEAVLQYFQTHQFTEIKYKQTPSFYHQTPYFEENIILFRLQATLFRQEIGAVIDWQNWSENLLSSQRKRDLKKAKKHEVQITFSENYDMFWNDILIPNLRNRHDKSPTHSLDEILYLKQIFPKNIQLITAKYQGQIIAGAVLFINNQVIHSQYIASNDLGKKLGALTLLFSEVLRNQKLKTSFFSFGISTENQGQHLNTGLHRWKEGFGAKAIPHNFYRIKTNSQFML